MDMKQVVTQETRGTKRCQGRDGQACTFGKNGKALRGSYGHRQCLWCSPERLVEACDRRASRGGLVKSFKNMSEEQQGRAGTLLPEKFQAYFVELASKQCRCQGYNGETCVFAESDTGGKAQVMQKKTQCLICDIELLGQQCSTQAGRSKVLTRLRRMAPTARHKAVEQRIPEGHRQYFQEALAVRGARGEAGARPACRKRPAAAMKADWKAVLEKRQSLRSCWEDKKQKAYRVQVLDDRARVRRRFGLPGRATRGEQVTNETGKRSKLGEQLHEWCTQHSWCMCRQCHSMVPLPLTELSLQRPLPKATIPAGSCARCQAKVACAAPLPEEVPEPLRNLSEESCQALAPLELDVGPEIRAAHNSGYRQHATIIRFAWKAQSVKKQIKHIENKEERAKAKAAWKFLLEKEDCSYIKFVEAHDKFLAKHPGADDRKRRRRLQFIETPGLETALWPHLFYLDSLCLTIVRSTDIRRRGSAYGPSLEAFLDAEVGDAESEDEDAVDGQRHSTKRAYAALALSARIGYGSSYELLHFAYDLNLWSALGAKKKTSVDHDIPMRVLMKGHSFSPLYWKAVHWALLDMVRQMGRPKVFWTISPYEWSMPYHVWLLDEMAKELRGRLHLAAAESLHVTHVLIQVVRGLLAGATGSKTKDRWERHLLRATGEDGKATRETKSLHRCLMKGRNESCKRCT